MSSQCAGTLKLTCSKPSTDPHTLGAAHCSDNVVVGSVSSELLREDNSSDSILGGGSVPVVQVGVEWVCTIVNDAVVDWLNKCALKKGSQLVGDIDKNQ